MTTKKAQASAPATSWTQAGGMPHPHARKHAQIQAQIDNHDIHFTSVRLVDPPQLHDHFRDKEWKAEAGRCRSYAPPGRR